MIKKVAIAAGIAATCLCLLASNTYVPGLSSGLCRLRGHTWVPVDTGFFPGGSCVAHPYVPPDLWHRSPQP